MLSTKEFEDSEVSNRLRGMVYSWQGRPVRSAATNVVDESIRLPDFLDADFHSRFTDIMAAPIFSMLKDAWHEVWEVEQDAIR